MRIFLLTLLAVSLLFGCSSSDDADTSDGDFTPDGDESETDAPDPDGDADTAEADAEEEAEVEADPSLLQAHTTLVQRLEPIFSEYGDECEDDDSDYCENPALAVPDLEVFEQAGFGEWRTSEGEALGREYAPGATETEYGTRRSLFTWAHMSDIHITDEESPSRLALYDTMAIPSALRPQDIYSEVVLDAAVRTINYFHAQSPIDLVLASGDMSDNAQYNEIRNFIGIMNGGLVDPDSGNDDDPVPGESNDPQDVFEAEGLQGIPWIVALGNHDQLILGNWEISEDRIATTKSGDASGGTRDGETFEIVSGDIVADENRMALPHQDMIRMFAEDPAAMEGHGFTQENVAENRGYYVYEPNGNAIVRFIVLDSAYRPYGYDSSSLTFVSPVIDREQHDDFLVPELERAKTDRKFVIVSMHHGSWKLQDDGYPEDYITTETLVNTLSAYPNVLIHCIGHSHENTLALHAAEDDESGYFEIQASSLIDWPQQFRFFELVDNGNGTLSVYTVVVDHQNEFGSMSEISRAYSLIDVQTGWGEGGSGVSEQRNVEMIFTIPDGFEDAVGQAAARENVQAVTTWTE